MTITIDSDRLHRELTTLAQWSDAEPAPDGTAVTRVVFTEADIKARAYLHSLYDEAGFLVRTDAVGNTFVRFSGCEPSLPAVGTGSHTDAIPHAGMYDGTVGVLGGLEAIRALKRAGYKPRRSIELVMFTAEEPTRFGIGCLGSRLMSGSLDPQRADSMRDAEGVTLSEARAAAGFIGPLETTRLPGDAYHAFVELHIEQGPLLECRNIPIGVVTHIAGPSSYRITIEGVGGHAGALLMPDRKDALCAAAELILAVERAARGTGSIDTVATVGTAKIHPGAVNSVPSRVVLELDLRDTDDTRRTAVLSAIRATYASVQRERGVVIHEQTLNADPPATSSPEIVATVARVCSEAGIPFDRMVSRAYHDSLFMARVAPIAMIFVPCRGGVSHRPDEYATPEQIAVGVRVLAESLAALSA